MTDTGCSYTREMIVLPSMCDVNSKLSIPAAFDIFQNTATLHADHFEIGPAGMNRRNYFWIISKTAMHINSLPSMMDHIEARTWIQPADRAKCERDFAIWAGDRCLVELRSIWAVVSHDTGRIVPLAELYPKVAFDIAPPDYISFSKIGKDFAGCEEIGSYTIRSVDIDLGGHMNNVNYIRAMLGCFSTEQLQNMNISDIEVQYIHQSYEGGMIRFMKRQTANGLELGAVGKDDKAVFLAGIR